MNLEYARGRVRTYRDTVSNEPADTAIFGSVSGSERVSTGQKILFANYKDTFCGSLDTDTVSCIGFAGPNFRYLS